MLRFNEMADSMLNPRYRARRLLTAWVATAISVALSIGAFAPLSADAAKISGGDSHSCFVDLDNLGQCWGYNGWGQIGDSGTLPRLAPWYVANFEKLVAISAGANHTCDLTTSGLVNCWGSDDKGQVGQEQLDSPFLSSPTPVRWIRKALGVSAGFDFSCAVLSDRRVSCWGDNSDGQLGIGSADNDRHPRPVGFGVVGLAPAARVSAGFSHACAVLKDKTLACWGDNTHGQIGDGTVTARTRPIVVRGLSGVVDVKAANGFTCAVLGDGGVRCWGANGSGQLGDGTLVERHSPVAVGSLSGVTQIEAGDAHVCALVAAGAVKCWGANAAGQLGNGTKVSSRVPVTALGVTGALEVGVGAEHSCARFPSRDVSVMCWGDNTDGQLGDGTSKTTVSTPAAVKKSTVRSTGGGFAFVMNPPPALSNRRVETLKLFAGTSVECSIDYSAYAPCTTTLTLSGLTEGPHAVQLRQLEGGVLTASLPMEWFVDFTRPVLTGVPKTWAVKGASSTTLNLAPADDATDIAFIEYRTTSSSPLATAVPVPANVITFDSTVVVPTKSKLYWLRVQDGAGNWSAWYKLT